MWITILAVKYFQPHIKSHPKVEHCLHSRWVTLSAQHPQTCLLWGKLQGKEHSVFYRILSCERVLCHALVKPEFSELYWEVGKEGGKQGRDQRRKEGEIK